MTPTVKSVQAILKQNKINETKRLENTVKQSSTNHSFTRGAAYYGGNEYCGQIEPAVRSFEPQFADNRASECGGESHLVCKGQNNNEPSEWYISMARYFI